MQIAVSPHIRATYDPSVDPPAICIIVSLSRAAVDCRWESRRREQVKDLFFRSYSYRRYIDEHC